MDIRLPLCVARPTPNDSPLAPRLSRDSVLSRMDYQPAAHECQNPHPTGCLVNRTDGEPVWGPPAAHFGTASLKHSPEKPFPPTGLRANLLWNSILGCYVRLRKRQGGSRAPTTRKGPKERIAERQGRTRTPMALQEATDRVEVGRLRLSQRPKDRLAGPTPSANG
jgi:hypothetical protein